MSETRPAPAHDAQFARYLQQLQPSRQRQQKRRLCGSTTVRQRSIPAARSSKEEEQLHATTEPEHGLSPCENYSVHAPPAEMPRRRLFTHIMPSHVQARKDMRPPLQ